MLVYTHCFFITLNISLMIWQNLYSSFFFYLSFFSFNIMLVFIHLLIHFSQHLTNGSTIFIFSLFYLSFISSIFFTLFLTLFLHFFFIFFFFSLSFSFWVKVIINLSHGIFPLPPIYSLCEIKKWNKTTHSRSFHFISFHFISFPQHSSNTPTIY